MTRPAPPGPASELLTVRDWLRYAMSAFAQARLCYGHGTDNALDEAAFLVLRALSLPPDQPLDPILDARLTVAERATLARLIAARVETRMPAPYLLGEAWAGGQRFSIDERVIAPRSFIAELLGRQAFDAWLPPEGPDRVLDLCTGSGCLAILAALAFPDAHITASDISADALAVAERNVADYGLGARLRLVPSDLFAALTGERFDLILCNPPYVSAAAMAALPAEYRHEPALALAGGEDGLDIVRRVLDQAGGHLSAAGLLVVEIGTGRAILEAERGALAFIWLDAEAAQGEVFALEAGALKA